MTCKVLQKKVLTINANRTRTHVLPVECLPHYATDIQNQSANLNIINKNKKKGDAPSSSNDGNLNERKSAISTLD